MKAMDKDIYKSSRVMYILWALFEHFTLIATSGVYLAKLTTSLGVADSTTAIISSIATFAGSFQIFAIMLSHKTPIKRWVVPLQSLSQVLLIGLYLIPFVDLGGFTELAIVLIMLFSHAVHNIITPAKTTWFVNMINPKTRGLFTATLNGVSIFGSIAFTLSISALFDDYEARGDIKGAFMILSIIIFVLTLLDLIALLVSKEKPVEKAEKISPIKELRSLAKNKKYIKFTAVSTLWSFASACTLPFLSTYQIDELGFDITFISLMTTAVSLLQLLCMYIWGIYSVRHSYFGLYRAGYTVTVIAYVVMMFTVPQNGRVMYVIYSVINLIGSSAVVIGKNLLYDIVDVKDLTTAIAINTVLSGAITFIATLVVSPLFNYIKETSASTIFGVTVYAQQIQSAITVLIGIFLIIFLYTGFTKTVSGDNSQKSS